jgi:RNA polymerase-binding transcription factor DksA
MTNDVKCIHCREIINPLRIKALPGAKTCVNCSTTGAKRGVSMMFGDKDDTWTDVVFMEEDTYKKHEQLTKSTLDVLNVVEKSDEEE